MFQDLASPFQENGCAICATWLNPKHDQVLDGAADIGSEFISRQWCLNEHIKHISAWTFGGQPRVDEEILKLERLRQQVLEKLKTDVFDPLGCSPPFIEIYHPSTVALALFQRGKGHTDCLGRIPLLQLFDYTDKEPLEETRLLFKDRLENIDQQDILGRSLLHVACQKKWREVAALLIRLGADSYLTNIYGHSPLHYAAASGSSEICKKLLRLGVAPEKEFMDCYGNSILYYAVCSQNFFTLQAILSSNCHKCPVVQNEQLCPPPLLRAVFDNNVEFAEAMIDEGARWDIRFRNRTIQKYITSIYCSHLSSTDYVRWHALSKRLRHLDSINQATLWNQSAAANVLISSQ